MIVAYFSWLVLDVNLHAIINMYCNVNLHVMKSGAQTSQSSVSDLLLYFGCPRRVYYTSRGFELLPEMTAARVERMLEKELALTYPELMGGDSLNADSLNSALKAALACAAEDLPLLYPGEFTAVDEALLGEGKALAEARLPEIGANLLQTLEEYGKKNFLAALTPVKSEPFLSSERLNLKGSPSKLVCFEETLLPSVIKTGNCPTSGVWARDRFHVTALVLLLEAERGKAMEDAFVEYAGHGLLRKVRLRAADRREVLKVCRRVEKIKNGFMPEKKEGPLCTHCSFFDQCAQKPSSLLSKLF
ncbi:MAG: Dna2/Cas4 domain-containing protein [Methanosarcinaceae archaeon]|nr:Dna2/Cas4 domain-containing protein [Methanosarcinaceae archaeon]